jgi:hypothetical protein
VLVCWRGGGGECLGERERERPTQRQGHPRLERQNRRETERRERVCKQELSIRMHGAGKK